MSLNSSNWSKNNHLEENVYKCLILSLPSHMKYNFLIASKTSFLDVHGQGCDFLTVFLVTHMRRFRPDNNYGFDTTEIMTTINTAKEGLQDQLRKIDARGGK